MRLCPRPLGSDVTNQIVVRFIHFSFFISSFIHLLNLKIYLFTKCHTPQHRLEKYKPVNHRRRNSVSSSEEDSRNNRATPGGGGRNKKIRTRRRSTKQRSSQTGSSETARSKVKGRKYERISSSTDLTSVSKMVREYYSIFILRSLLYKNN